MNIYVPNGETGITEQENIAIVNMLGELGAQTFRTPDLDSATSMVASGTNIGEAVGSEATYVATRLGRDVLFICNSTGRRDELIARLGTGDFSIMAATSEVILQSALKLHIDSQKILENMMKAGIPSKRNH